MAGWLGGESILNSTFRFHIFNKTNLSWSNKRITSHLSQNSGIVFIYKYSDDLKKILDFCEFTSYYFRGKEINVMLIWIVFAGR